MNYALFDGRLSICSTYRRPTSPLNQSAISIQCGYCCSCCISKAIWKTSRPQSPAFGYHASRATFKAVLSRSVAQDTFGGEVATQAIFEEDSARMNKSEVLVREKLRIVHFCGGSLPYGRPVVGLMTFAHRDVLNTSLGISGIFHENSEQTSSSVIGVVSRRPSSYSTSTITVN